MSEKKECRHDQMVTQSRQNIGGVKKRWCRCLKCDKILEVEIKNED